LTNAVSGTTAGGAKSYLKLKQYATGGGGGGSGAATGGVGGAATSSLSFDDLTANTKHVPYVYGLSRASGGGGGNGATGGGAGGAATASLTLTGASSVSAMSNATGGIGGVGAAGGNATATSDAIGTTLITSNAAAFGGNGNFGAGTASATAIGQGASGDAQSAATSGSITSGSLATAASADANARVAGGTSTALTWAAIGNGIVSAPALVADQAVAQITAEPTTADVNTINNNNAAIKSAFTTGKTPTCFGIGELGGAYSTSGSGSETETSSIHMTVDLTKFSPHDLIIGFYSGTSAGAGFTSMTLDVKINGVDSVHNPATFTTVGHANSFFQNNAVDFDALSGTSLQLDMSLSITESSAGGYDFGMLIGDPPPAQQSNALALLGHAAASFGGGGGANVGGSSSAPPDKDTLQLANPNPHAVT
jgi:hypothetical protein